MVKYINLTLCGKLKPELAHSTHLLISDGVKAGGLNLLAVLMKPHVAQHHDCAEQQCSRVGHVQACYVRSSTVDLGKGKQNQSADISIP